MKIALINTTDGMGGAALIARRLAESLRRRGHEAVLVVGRKSSSLEWVMELPMAGERGALGRVARRLLSIVSRKAASDAEAAHRWRRCLQELNLRSQLDRLYGREDFNLLGCGGLLDQLPFRPELLHLHNLHSFIGATHFDLRQLPFLSKQVPMLFTLHDAWLLTGHCGHYFGCQRWRTGCGLCPNLSTYPSVRKDRTAKDWRRRAELFGQSRYHLAGPCRWIVENAAQSPLARGLQGSRVIPNGVDTGFFCPATRNEAVFAAFGADPKQPALCLISEHGRANPHRDHAYALRLLEAYGGREDVPPLTAFLVGGEVGKRTQGAVTYLGTGLIRQRETLRDLLSGSQVLLHPAIADTFPTVILEAMACGVPVLGTPVCGLVDQIVEGETGYFIQLDDPEMGANTLVSMLKTPKLHARLSREARATAVAKFEEASMISSYENYYGEILEHSRACR